MANYDLPSPWTTLEDCKSYCERNSECIAFHFNLYDNDDDNGAGDCVPKRWTGEPVSVEYTDERLENNVWNLYVNTRVDPTCGNSGNFMISGNSEFSLKQYSNNS